MRRCSMRSEQTAMICNLPVDDDQPQLICSKHAGEVYLYCDQKLHGWRLERPEQSEPPERAGYVYFARVADRIKIGYSTTPKVRVKAFYADELLHYQRGTMLDEKRLHAAFAHIRIQGEWFSAAPDLLDFIAGLKAAA